jgi:lipid A ethanolaminephosphotransferase
MAETNVAEVRDLMSFKFAAYILLLGVLPSVLLWKAQIAYRAWHRELLGKLVVSGACVVAWARWRWSTIKGCRRCFAITMNCA